MVVSALWEGGDGLIKKICPKCGSYYIYYRKTFSNYRCQTCEAVFDEPLTIYSYDHDFAATLDNFLEKREKTEVVLQKPKIDYSRCVLCGKKADVIHHINLDRKDDRFDNLVPLCNECHGSFYGSLNAVIGDIASVREAMTILIDKRVDVRTIYSALQTLRTRLGTPDTTSKFAVRAKNNRSE